MKLIHCPGCHFKGKSSLLGGSWFYVYTCAKCGYKYCYQCKESNNGQRCPACGSSDQKGNKDEVYMD